MDKTPLSAVARIAVDSKYWLWVTGNWLCMKGELKRGPNPTDTYYDVVDLTPHLRKGSNTLAILAWYWGKDGYSHKSSGKAGLVAELNLDGRRIGTGEDWKVLRHPAYGTTGDPHPNYRMPDDNIHFDGRADLGDWTPRLLTMLHGRQRLFWVRRPVRRGTIWSSVPHRCGGSGN